MVKKKNNIVFVIAIIIVLIFLFFLPNIINYFQPVIRDPVSIYLNQKSKIQNHINKQNNEKDYRKLFELNFQGIPEKYDINGNKINGVKPDANMAILYLKKLIDTPEGTNNDVLRLGKIYEQGMHNFQPDLDEAEKIYSAILNNCGELDIRTEAQTSIDNISKSKALDWLNLPQDHDPQNPNPNQNDNVFRVNRTRINNDNFQQEVYQVRDPGINNFDDIAFEILNNEQFNINQILLAQFDINNDTLDTPDILGTKQYNDPQNTHDSQVLKTMVNSIDNLKENTNITKSYDTVYNEITEYIKQIPNQSQKIRDALISLNSINNSEQLMEHGDLKMTGRDALELVWNRIDDPIFENKDDVKNILIEELASMHEHDEVVCPTGRFVRIIDTLNVIDPEVNIKPKYAINEEMMNKSAKIRNDMLNSRDDKDMLERGTSPNQNDFDNKLKENILDQLKKEYVDTNILNNDEFTIEINKWIDFI